MTLDLEAARLDLQATDLALPARGLTWGTSGNASRRLGAGRFVITASGTNLGRLAEDDFVVCGPEGEALPARGRRPSKEMPIHRAFYDRCPAAGAGLELLPAAPAAVADFLNNSGYRPRREWR